MKTLKMNAGKAERNEDRESQWVKETHEALISHISECFNMKFNPKDQQPNKDVGKTKWTWQESEEVTLSYYPILLY